MSTAFHHLEADNGLPIIGETNPASHSVAVGFFVRTGSRDENADEAGVSHFLEHMVFKGSKKRKAEQLNAELDLIGSSPNAYTSEETTVFYASCLPRHLGRALEVLADIMRPALRAEDFNLEKNVILEEIGMYEDQPGDMVFDHARKLFFGDHPLGNSILGTTSSITDLKRDQMADYFQRRYQTGNIVLACAGHFDFEEFAKLAQKHCGRWPAGAPRRTEIRQTAGTGEFDVRVDDRTILEHLVVMNAGPPAASPLRHAADLIAMAVGDDSGSRMYWEIVDPGHAESATMSFREHEGTGLYYASVECEPGKAQKNLERVFKIIDKLQSGGITQEELDVARTKLLSRMVRGSESPMSRLMSLGNHWIYQRKHISLEDEIRSYKKVNMHQVRQLLDRYPFKKMTVQALGPGKKLKPLE
jgi:predicted Zn-dependent peptidase